MTTAMKLTTGILAMAITMTAGRALAQNPDAIDNARSVAKSLQQKQANDTNAALAAAGVPQTAKPAAGAPAPAVKPAVVPASKPVAAPAKAASPAPAPASKPAAIATAKPAPKPAAPATAAKNTPAAKPQPAAAKPVATKTPASAKAVTPAKPAPKAVERVQAAASAPAANPAANASEAKPQPKPEPKKWAMTGKRDPFFSPVVQQPAGSGCSTGKKCLEIGSINLRGVVKSENGFIAVVTNSLNKAYFLRENDPVFDGYVVKITGTRSFSRKQCRTGWARHSRGM